jgi:hypothetical protein
MDGERRERETRGRQKRKREWKRVKTIDTPCICVWQYNAIHGKLLNNRRAR